MMTRSAAEICAKSGARSGPSMASVRSSGVKRAASRRQLSTSEVGQTIREGGGRRAEGGSPGGVFGGGVLREEVGERLERFAEAHLVGQDAAQSVAREELQPADAFELVRAEDGGQRGCERLVGGGVGGGPVGCAIVPRRERWRRPIFRGSFRRRLPGICGGGKSPGADWEGSQSRRTSWRSLSVSAGRTASLPLRSRVWPAPIWSRRWISPAGKRSPLLPLERDFHLEPVLARAAHGDLRGDDLDLLADVGEARADRDLPAGEFLQAGHPEGEEAQDGVLAAQEVVAGGVGAGEAPAREAFAGGAFGGDVARMEAGRPGRRGGA